MASGPINGGQGLSPLPGYFDPVSGVLIPTLLQMSEDIMRYFTGMTCLYNRYWQAEESRITLPVAMFHVTGITETWQNEVSKKRVIMYEPPQSAPAAKDLSDALRPSVMQVFMDNIVTQPKSYQLEVIIPFMPLGRYISDGVEAVLAGVVGILQMFLPENVSSVVESIIGGVRAVFSTFKPVLSMAGMLPDTGGVNTINKNSLEAMAECGKILTMKMWTGYHYKYVVVTGMTISKRSNEDSIFRGTIQVQEMPVLTMTVPEEKNVEDVKRDWSAKGILGSLKQAQLGLQAMIVAPLIQSLGVVEASGQQADLTDRVKAAVGI
jgi:hypothetical protein